MLQSTNTRIEKSISARIGKMRTASVGLQTSFDVTGLRSIADVELLPSCFLLCELHLLGLLAVEQPVPWLGSVRPEHGDRAHCADRRDADKHLGVPGLG